MNAPSKATELKALIVAVISGLTAFWGWLGWAVVIFLACMAADYVTGSLAAKAHGEWSSAIAREGLWHKLGEIAALLVAMGFDVTIKVILSSGEVAQLLGGVNYRNYATMLVAVWYIFTELGSIAENAQKLGAPVPSWLMKGIEKMKNKTDESARDEGGGKE